MNPLPAAPAAGPAHPPPAPPPAVPESLAPADDGVVAPCPNCGAPMVAVRGSKQAICGNCGFKDSCCF